MEAFLLDENSPYRNGFLWRMSLGSPESVPLRREFPLKRVPLIGNLLYLSLILQGKHGELSSDFRIQPGYSVGFSFSILSSEKVFAKAALHILPWNCGYLLRRCPSAYQWSISFLEHTNERDKLTVHLQDLCEVSDFWGMARTKKLLAWQSLTFKSKDCRKHFAVVESRIDQRDWCNIYRRWFLLVRHISPYNYSPSAFSLNFVKECKSCLLHSDLPWKEWHPRSRTIHRCHVQTGGVRSCDVQQIHS